MEKYIKKYPYYMMLASGVMGAGVGMLLTYPLAGQHPVRWGVGLVVAAVVMKVAVVMK